MTAQLPSIFAIRAIRHRVLENCELSSSREELVRMLRLDPLTLLRCLRLAGAPLVGLDRTVNSVPTLVDRLGRSFVLRSFRVEEAPDTDFRAIHSLWLHSIATAFAAESLAEISGEMCPEEAYLRGLLRRLPQWLQLLDPGARDDINATIERWTLPPALREDFIGASPPNELCVLEAAEGLADLADFPTPGDENAIGRDEILTTISKERLVQAHELRHAVQRHLQVFGLETAAPATPPANVETPTAQFFWIEPNRRQTEFITGLLLCRQSSTYRSIVTVATSAALRYLDFDRATLILWNRETQSCFVKAKADFTIRRLEPTGCPLAPNESDTLREALASERPQHLVRPKTGDGLLAKLGADEALLVMVNREFETPTFLVLDRTLSGRGLDMEGDSTNAAALGGTVAILTDNLRLRLDRIRAQRFAVIDPLTRLNNRAVGLMALEREMLRARREDLALSVLMLDLDEFKELNDTHGHLVGDQALRLTANVLRRTLRRTDVLCRYGGEEFLVVLPATSPQEASILATRLFIEVAESGEEYRLPLTVSIGLSCLREGDSTTDDMVGRADRALYASKTRGRNRFSVDTI